MKIHENSIKKGVESEIKAHQKRFMNIGNVAYSNCYFCNHKD